MPDTKITGTLTTASKDANEDIDVEHIISSLKSLPSKLITILKKAIQFLLYASIFLGVFLVLLGIIEWTTGWNEYNGKRNIVRGIILLAIALTTASL